MTGKELARLAAALLLGACLAFPAGLWIAGRGDGASPQGQPPRTAAGREMFSPSIRDDPYFVEQQRKGIEALEAECRRTGAFCAEARQARERLEDVSTD